MYPRSIFQSFEYMCKKCTISQSTSFYRTYTVDNLDLENVSIIKIILLLDLGERQISITSNIIPNKMRETKVHTSGHKLRPHKKAQWQSIMLA